MKSKIQQRTNLLLYIFALFGLTAVGYIGVSAIFGTGIKTVEARQDPFLSQRLNQIEQRFTSIESRLNRVEQQSRFPITTPDLSVGRDTELRLIRSQVETLQSRIVETECGLAKLDERTLSNTARQQRKSGAEKTNICRQTPNTPIQLSARP